jgi:hypothetical protein
MQLIPHGSHSLRQGKPGKVWPAVGASPDVIHLNVTYSAWKSQPPAGEARGSLARRLPRPLTRPKTYAQGEARVPGALGLKATGLGRFATLGEGWSERKQKRFFLVFLSVEALLEADPSEF